MKSLEMHSNTIFSVADRSQPFLLRLTETQPGIYIYPLGISSLEYSIASTFALQGGLATDYSKLKPAKNHQKSETMSPIPNKVKDEITLLESKIDTLIARHRKRQEQVAKMQSAELALNEERAQLGHKNELAKSKIESMLKRLKNLEQA